MKNCYAYPSGREYLPLDAIRHVSQAGRLADGRPIPRHLKPTLTALAIYWPNIRPTLPQLARDTGLLRSTVAEHLKQLGPEGLDVVRTHREGRTAHRLLQLDRLVTVDEKGRSTSPVEPDASKRRR